MNRPKRLFTTEQMTLVKEFEAFYGIDESQISFDGDDPNPIFDYAAVSHLSLRLTDIEDIECWIVSRDPRDNRSTAKCKVTLPDGRTRSVEGSAAIDEILYDTEKINTWSVADSTAQSRASRLGIRAVGINLVKAHRDYVKSGKVTPGHTNSNPLKPYYDEIHVLAENLGLIVAGDKSEYRKFLAETFGGKESCLDLEGSQLQQLLNTLRTLDRVRRSRKEVAAAA